jgi:hypothetical protein
LNPFLLAIYAILAIIDDETRIAKMPAGESATARVREWVQNHIVQPARARGDRLITVTAGEVHNQLGLTNRVPVVCQALRSKRFLEANHLVLKDVTGPPSGLSTTVKFTYEIVSGDSGAKGRHPLWDLLGIGKTVFRELGGGENFIKSERAKLLAPVEAQGVFPGENSPRSGSQRLGLAVRRFRGSKRGRSAKSSR